MEELKYDEEDISNQSHRYHTKAKFLIDECLGIEVSIQLKELKYKAIYVDEVGLTGKSDETVFGYAWKHRYVLLTHDMDFWNDRIFPLSSSRCVIIFPGRNGEENILIKAISTAIWLVGKLSDLYMNTKIAFEGNNDFIIKRWNREDGKVSRIKYRLSNGKIFYENID